MAYEEALCLDPIYERKGQILSAVGRYEEVLQAYDEALHLDVIKGNSRLCQRDLYMLYEMDFWNATYAKNIDAKERGAIA